MENESPKLVAAPAAVTQLVHSLHRNRKDFSNNRLILKNGLFNISQKGIKKRRRQYLADIFTTLIDLKWRWTLLLFITAFVVTWICFAFLWWMVAYANNDLTNVNNSDWPRCVAGLNGFVSAVLFSIETQHTIGYGSRSITENCSGAIALLMIQSNFGVIIQALMTGLVFAKLARPQKRAETLMFSDRACICKRDNQLVLLIRVGDMRSSNIIGARMDAILIHRRTTLEGEIIALDTKNINLGDANNRLLLRWPAVIEHKIDESSPLWLFSKYCMETKNFEIFVILEGNVPSTGASTQAMTSYLPEEIMWGHQFRKLVTYQKENGKYLFDYTDFHMTEPHMDTPFYSGAQLALVLHESSSADEQDGSAASLTDIGVDAVDQWMSSNMTTTHRYNENEQQEAQDYPSIQTSHSVRKCQSTQTTRHPDYHIERQATNAAQFLKRDDSSNIIPDIFMRRSAAALPIDGKFIRSRRVKLIGEDNSGYVTNKNGVMENCSRIDNIHEQISKCGGSFIVEMGASESKLI